MKFLLLFCFLLSPVLRAHESLQTNNHLDVYNKAVELGHKYGAKKVLVVLDIDNTLLKARQPLGSDQWFEWQAEAIKQSTAEAVFKNFDELLEAQTDFFQLSRMSLTEAELPEMINALKASGHYVLLLTSRGPGIRNVTERELLNNKIGVADSSIMQGIPFDFMEPPFKSKVSFMNGIFMTAGHYKGEALAYIIKKARKDFKAIIFADDHERHTRRVAETYAQSDTEMITFRYGREDNVVFSFKQGPKETINNQTKELIGTYRKIFKMMP